MNLSDIQKCERSKIEKWSKFQLSYPWKTIGIILSIAVFLMLLGLKLIDDTPIWASEILKRLLIVGFLMISISKEKEEDEMIASLRAKSYTLAFIFGVLYALIQPVVDGLVHTYIYTPSETNTFSYFQILWFMLLIQILFFEVLKRNR